MTIQTEALWKFLENVKPEPHIVDFHGFRLVRHDGREDENFDDFGIRDEGMALDWLNEMAAKEGV